MHQHELEEHDRGLVYDLDTLDRRRVLKLLGFGGLSAGLFTLIGCGPTGATGSASAAAAATDATGASCALVPEETAGPFPGDGSNGPNVLAESGVVRSDIRSSFGSSTTVAEGVPLTIQLTVQDARMRCRSRARRSTSGTATGTATTRCTRRRQPTRTTCAACRRPTTTGLVTFTSIFPACYPGRWPHIHFEVYPSLELATDEQNKIATSQIALPQDACETVYATAGYEQSVRTLGQVSLASDMVFSDDGGVHQLGTVTGSVADGYTVALTVAVEG